MDIRLFISVVSGLFFVCLVIAVPIILIWWVRHIRKIKKEIPKELEEKIERRHKDNEINQKQESYKRIKEEIRRERSIRRGVEESGYSKNNNYIKGQRRVPILPSKQSIKPKREPKEDWPSFE